MDIYYLFTASHRHYQWFFERRHISQWAKVSRSDTLFRKADPLDKSNYQPISLFSHIEPFLSKVLTGFLKNYDTQHSLLKILANFKEALDKGNSVLSSWTYPKHMIA